MLNPPHSNGRSTMGDPSCLLHAHMIVLPTRDTTEQQLESHLLIDGAASAPPKIFLLAAAYVKQNIARYLVVVEF